MATTSDDAVGLAIGRVLDGRYRIEGVLGSGGMGHVYRAEHVGLGRTVAIKVLHADLGRNREVAARFQREALASGRLDHANIVAVSDFGVLDEGGCFLVMEALEGETLGERLDREERIEWREAVEIVRSVVVGLRHAHDRGVVHRDIKPDNVFLARKDGETMVKILDFGIAKLYAGSPTELGTTSAGLTIGTPAYLSPEQAVGGDITPASDLYSATIVLFEMVTGRTPFSGEPDPIAMLTAHTIKPPPRLREVAAELELPAALEALVEHGLAKRAVERIGSADEYLRAVDELLGVQRSDARRSQPAIALGALAAAPGARAFTPLPLAPTPVALTAVPSAAVDSSSPFARLRRLPHRGWYAGGAIAILLVVVVATTARCQPPTELALATIAADGGAAHTPVVVTDAAAVAPRPDTRPIVPPPHGQDAHAGDDAKLKSALAELVNGKTCKERAAAIPTLVELGDPRAIEPLKRARHWWHDRYFGLQTEDWNACLTKQATDAIKKLSPPT